VIVALIIGLLLGYYLHPTPDPWQYTEAWGQRWCLVAQHKRVAGLEYPGREVYMVDIDGDWARVFAKCG